MSTLIDRPVCEICGENTRDKDKRGTLICLDCQGKCWYCGNETTRTDGKGIASCCPSHDER